MAPRVKPPPTDTLDPRTAGLLALAVSPAGETLATVAVLAHRPPLLGPFLGWAAALALEGALTPRHHEILALRAAHRCGSAFEWDEHVGYGQQAGLSAAEVAWLAEGPGAVWEEAELALVRAADELCVDHAISDATWSTLAKHFDEAALVEIPYVVGQYTMLSMVANALQLARRG